MLSGAIVGFGNVAQFGHWPAYQNSRDVRIAGVVDADAERRALAKSLSLNSFERLDQLGELDFVDVCTPPANHADQIVEAARRGWHVLCEKPLVINSAELRRIAACSVGDEEVRARAQPSVAIVPVHNWKYAPIIRRATELLRSGAIGRLQRVEISVLRTEPAASTGANWRANPELAGGGIVMDHGWHAIYLALHWFGARANAVDSELVRSAGAESEATVNITFHCGSAEIFLSWKAPTRENRIRLIGDRGAIAIDDDLLRTNEITERFEQRLSAGSHHPDWFAAMLPDVLAAFHDPARARASFDEAAECLRIIEQAYATG